MNIISAIMLDDVAIVSGFNKNKSNVTSCHPSEWRTRSVCNKDKFCAPMRTSTGLINEERRKLRSGGERQNVGAGKAEWINLRFVITIRRSVACKISKTEQSRFIEHLRVYKFLLSPDEFQFLILLSLVIFGVMKASATLDVRNSTKLIMNENKVARGSTKNLRILDLFKWQS